MLCAEVVLRLVHLGVSLLDLLLDLLLHFLLLGFGHSGLEAVRTLLLALSLSLVALTLILLFLLVILLAGVVLRIGADLIDIHFLGAFNTLSLLGFLRLELGKVYLSDNLDPGSAFGSVLSRCDRFFGLRC